jgi:hypothetical protein
MFGRESKYGTIAQGPDDVISLNPINSGIQIGKVKILCSRNFEMQWKCACLYGVCCCE